MGGFSFFLRPTTVIFHCPSANSKRTDKTSDYFFNARLSGVSIKKITSPNLTISLGDGAPEQPFDAHLSQLPAPWLHDSASPARRHLDGANYAFIDGHVKWFKHKTIIAPEKGKSAPTFLVR